MNRIQIYRRFKDATNSTSYKNIRFPQGSKQFWENALKSVTKPKTAKRTGKHRKVVKKSTKKVTKIPKVTSTKKVVKPATKKVSKIPKLTQEEQIQQQIQQIQQKYKITYAENIQNYIIKQEQLVTKKEERKLNYYDQLPEAVKYLDENMIDIIQDQIDEILSDKDVLDMLVQIKYVPIHYDAELDRVVIEKAGAYWESKYTELQDKETKFQNEKAIVERGDSDISEMRFFNDSIDVLKIGYRILVNMPNVRKDIKNVYDLRAYHPCSDRKYHNMCTVSTTENGKICIYESWYHIFKKSIKNKHRKNLKFSRNMMNELSKEGQEIMKSVQNGELIRSLELLTKKYNKNILVAFYKDSARYLSIEKGKLNETPDIDKYSDCEILLYDGHHVAPSKLDILNKYSKTNSKKSSSYRLMPIYRKKEKKSTAIVHYLEYEIVDKENIFKYQNIKVDGKLIGDVNSFCNYLDTYERMDAEKTRKSKQVDKHIFYGIHNSKYLNLDLIKILEERDPAIKYYIKKSAIPRIKYRSCEIRDMSLFKIESIEEMKTIYDSESEVECVRRHHSKFSSGKIGKRFWYSNAHTPSSLSLDIFQQCFLNEVLTGSYGDQYEAELSSYHGSMNGYTKTGKVHGPINYYDIYSSYPSVMKNGLIPYKLKSARKMTKIITNANHITDTNLYHVRVTSTDSKMISTGPLDVWTWMWGIELSELLKSECKVECDEVRIYETRKNVFSGYVDYFYEQKRSGCNLAKLMLNSLYGKFGQKRRMEYRRIKNLSEHTKYCNFRDILELTEFNDGTVCIGYLQSENYLIGSLVRLASYISASARVSLHEAMRSLNYDVLYWDTDSIITTKTLDNKYITKTKELGKWKIEGIFQEAKIIGKKTYVLINEDKTKSLFKCSGGKITNEDANKIISEGYARINHTYEKRENNKIRKIVTSREIRLK